MIPNMQPSCGPWLSFSTTHARVETCSNGLLIAEGSDWNAWHLKHEHAAGSSRQELQKANQTAKDSGHLVIDQLCLGGAIDAAQGSQPFAFGLRCGYRGHRQENLRFYGDFGGLIRSWLVHVQTCLPLSCSSLVNFLTCSVNS